MPKGTLETKAAADRKGSEDAKAVGTTRKISLPGANQILKHWPLRLTEHIVLLPSTPPQELNASNRIGIGWIESRASNRFFEPPRG
jgi:hypothetical protein